MSDRRRVWIAGIAAFLLVLLPFGNFVKTNCRDGAFVPVNFVCFFLQTAPLVFAVVGALAFLLCRCTSGRAPHAFSRAVLTVGGAFFLLFFYHHYAVLLSKSIDGSIAAGSFLFLVALLAVLLFRLAKHPPVLVAGLVFAGANMGLALPSIAETTAEAVRIAIFRTADAEGRSVAETEARPNIYYFILDAYPSVSSLRQNLTYDNGPFIAAMQQRGFYNAESAISSYNRTVFTLAAIFAQDYFVTNGMTLQEGIKGRLTYPSLLNAPQPPNLVAEARSLGYEFHMIGNYWAPCAGPWVSCDAAGGASAYLADVFWSATPGGSLVAMARAGDAGEAPDVDAIGKLRERLKKSGAPKAPAFTFVHHLSPHAPFMFHADCSLRDEYGVDLTEWVESTKPYFLDNLACVNIKAVQIADDIMALDPNSVVVFQGDHGTSFTVTWDEPFDAWSPSSIHERSSILNLVRLPERCQTWLTPDLDNVTTVRAVMGCVAGRAAVPDRPRGYVTTFSGESPDHGQVRLIDPLTFRALPEAGRD
ncbi:sulfatase-like hydrolase/transferase [Pelagibius marinus]|uniref:sulfatase-like hydrolase/transferase n=1 Tax=Pelagibius marinus TaxID=2762760 RepID=UPI001872E6F1|nr:sulfatase-like hydrolase/transferase [Pelagibius marinus]